jgi:hypothetical protein
LSARRNTLFWLVLTLLCASAARAQDPGARRAYFGAVASYFKLPPSEVQILADWQLDPDQIPAVLFVARHAGVSPEALVALLRSGQGWPELAERYEINAATLHVAVGDGAATGSLSGIYERYRATPVTDWRSIRLSEPEIVGLVNVRVIAQTLRIPAEEVVRHTGSVSSYVELYARLSR